ncbi:uncharacterized protein [Apostichopus japonicus]|uniref:uncharacterized protein n=1 Tax=Stichopus japonicus TaxID=307972 RepID=UPI003AB132AB
MDDFKLNAAKIIAAQQKKSRAQSPDSVSNWDSSEPEETVNNVSSGEEISTRSTRSQKDRRSTLQDKKPKKRTSTSTPKKQQERSRGAPSKATDVSSSGSNMRKGVNSFVDRHADDSVERTRDVESRGSRKLKDDDNPPYDFSSALGASDANRGSPADLRPGQSRKGNNYDIPEGSPRQKRRGSWDVSDEDERIIMEELGGTMEDQGKETIASSHGGGRGEAKKEGDKHKSKWSLRKKKTTSGSNKGNINNAMNVSQQHLIANSGDYDASVLYNEEKDFSVVEDQDPSRNETVEEALMRKETKDARYIYHFHQGSTRYFDTRNGQNEVYMSNVADKSEKLVRRCISEVFSTLRIVADFFVILFLEFLRFLTFRIIGACLVGVVVIAGDFLLKPFLTSCFNSICQPVAAFSYNCCVACRTISLPLRDTLTALCTPCAMLLRAIRLVEVNWNSNKRMDVEEV